MAGNAGEKAKAAGMGASGRDHEGQGRASPGDYSTAALREAARILRRALQLVAARERWTRGVWARDGSRQEVNAWSEVAVAWCVGGAVLCAAADLTGRAPDIPADATGEAIAVVAPNSAVIALRILARELVAANSRLVDLDARPKTKRVQVSRLRDQHPTLLASDVNDLTQITHARVLLGLARALVVVDDELVRRRRNERQL